MKVVLQRIFDGIERDEIVVQPSRFLIGKGNDCQLRPFGFFVAEHHCEIELKNDEATVRHLGEHGTTLVNGHDVQSTRRLSSGDILTVGLSAYRVFLLADSHRVRMATSDATVHRPIIPRFAGQLS